MVYDHRQHIPIMTLPGMRDRSIRIGSAGKTFFNRLESRLFDRKRGVIEGCFEGTSVFGITTPPNLQRAVADGLNGDGTYFDRLILICDLKEID